MNVRELLGILAQHDEGSEVAVELETDPGPFRAFTIDGEAGISVYGAGGICVLTCAAPVFTDWIATPEEKSSGVPPAFSGAEGDDR